MLVAQVSLQLQLGCGQQRNIATTCRIAIENTSVKVAIDPVPGGEMKSIVRWSHRKARATSGDVLAKVGLVGARRGSWRLQRVPGLEGRGSLPALCPSTVQPLQNKDGGRRPHLCRKLQAGLGGGIGD